jgi:hypothetical protein
MYKIVGSDGKAYGPISAEQARQWLAEGRINAHTQVQPEGSAEWKPVAAVPELSAAMRLTFTAPLSPAVTQTGQSHGLAITSFVLGLLSMFCAGVFTGIPAVICGHLARGRAKRAPAQYGGAGFALAGLIMGYGSVLVTIAAVALIWGMVLQLSKGMSTMKPKAQSIQCVTHMKQIGLACRIWSNDNNDQFPFNVSTNKGGTLEWCARDTNGFDSGLVYHFQVMSNELSSPKILVCPADTTKWPALNFLQLTAQNISYQLRSGREVDESKPRQVLARCPIHGHTLFCDGSVQAGQ